MQTGDRYERGKAMRTKVLGRAAAERISKRARDVGEAFQRFRTEVAWGDIWTRPGLDLKTRSLCTVAILATLGRFKTLRFHLVGALNNGAKALLLGIKA